MKAVQQIIRILVIIQLVQLARCQDGFSDRDILRYQQMAANEPQIEAITSYNSNIMQRDPNSQAISSVNVQYHVTDDSQNEYNRADRIGARTRKVYRIKNPFQNQLEEINQKNDGNVDPQDTGTAASNQYASMQYSLPPEEFLQQMRENQYHQQQPQTTPAPNLSYTATPLPQYQYSTITSGGYDTNQQTNQIPQLEPKSHTQYLTNTGYQFNPTNTFPFDSVQSTPAPATNYISTALPNSQYGGGPSGYVSSSSPIYLSSPPNLQQYVSSPFSNIQTGSPDYSGNRVTTTIGSNSLSYDTNDQNKKLQIDHYDNSANGIRYPANFPQQYQNEYVSSTLSPTSVSYDSQNSWQNNINSNVNTASKSLQDASLTQYQNNYPYNNQQDARSDSALETNTDTHRIGSMPSANNVYLNFAQPEYQTYGNNKARPRDVEQETGQTEYYSNGDYGWKLGERKLQTNNDGYSSANSANFQRYQPNLSNTGQAMSQMTFHMDTSKPSTYETVSKSASEIEAQEFAKAAASAHEYMKQQQQQQQQSYYSNSYSNNQGSSYNSNPYYTVDKQKTKYPDVSTPAPYLYSPQPDLITASPYYYNRENSIDNKPKQPFDHAKALKTIVPIDVSNVLSNSDSQLKGVGVDTNRYNIQNYGKEQLSQNLQPQQYRPLSDSYYKDKNAYYGLNIKTKPEEYSAENTNQYDTNTPYYTKPQQSPESVYQSYSTGPQRVGFNSPQNFQDNIQSSANVQQQGFQGFQRPQSQVPTDINSILKLNDVPYQLTQSLSPESFRLQNSEFDHGNLPTQLPIRVNQDVASHQLDVTSNILNKLLLNKQAGIPFSRPEYEAPNGISTINGFKVANPFNVDLKLVAEMLRGKSPENTNIMTLRDQFSKQAPIKFDLSQLHYLLKNENIGNLSPINEGLSALSNPFIEVYNSGRFPYQGVKYSRSQEEEEDTIVPIADASNNHPIGAVTDQEDPTHERDANTESEATGQGEEGIAINFDDERAKKSFLSGHRMQRDRHRHPNALPPGRHSYPRKYPRNEVEEPYPLLKPPPPRRGRGSHTKPEKQGRRRRVNKPRVFKPFKTEALFEAEHENENVEDSVPTLLRPPPPVVESKSDKVEDIEEIS